MKWLKRILLLIIIIPVLILGIFFLIRYFAYFNDKDPYKTFLAPRIAVSVIEIKRLTYEQTDLTSKILIKNTLPLTLKLDSISYKFLIRGVEVYKSKYRKSISIRKNDSTWIVLPAVMFNQRLLNILKKSAQQKMDSVYYELKADFYTNYTFGKKISIDQRKLLPLVYIPEIKLNKTHVDSLSLHGAALALHILIGNKNIFPLKAKGLSYRFAIGENEWLEGKTSELLDIPAKGTKEIILPLKVSFKQIRKTIPNFLEEGTSIAYKLEINFKIVSKDNMLKDSKVLIISTGTLKELQTLKKETKKKKKHQRLKTN